jgi:hypothetical protein
VAVGDRYQRFSRQLRPCVSQPIGGDHVSFSATRAQISDGGYCAVRRHDHRRADVGILLHKLEFSLRAARLQYCQNPPYRHAHHLASYGLHGSNLLVPSGRVWHRDRRDQSRRSALLCILRGRSRRRCSFHLRPVRRQRRPWNVARQSRQKICRGTAVGSYRRRDRHARVCLQCDWNGDPRQENDRHHGRTHYRSGTAHHPLSQCLRGLPQHVGGSLLVVVARSPLGRGNLGGADRLHHGVGTNESSWYVASNRRDLATSKSRW